MTSLEVDGQGTDPAKLLPVAEAAVAVAKLTQQVPGLC